MNFIEPQEETYTHWHNPLGQEQRVDVFYGDEPRPTRFTWKPGETLKVPSRFDNAIHRVDKGVIIGGLAPQLVKVGANEVLDPALDTEKVKKAEATKEAAVAALAKSQAEDALVIAQAKSAEATEALASKAESAERALPPEKRSKDR